MTRKEVLILAQERVRSKEVADVLQEIIGELPLIGWTKNRVQDSINQFIKDNCRVPSCTDFKKRGLPTAGEMQYLYGVPLKEFLDNLHPNRKKCDGTIYYTKTKDEWLEFFINTYKELSPRGAIDYNRLRSSGTPTWATIANINGVTKWNDLLKLAGLQHKVTRIITPRQKIVVEVKSNYMAE